MSKSPSYLPNEAIEKITLMVNLKPPRSTHFTVWGEKGPSVLCWEDMFEIVDIRINDKPFHGLASTDINIRFNFSSKPSSHKRSFFERIMGVMPSYWADFFIGFKGHYCASLDIDLAHFDYISKCDTLIFSSRDFRDDKGKPIKGPITYARYTEEKLTSVINLLNFAKYSQLPEGGGGKSKPKPSLETYFQSMPEQHMIFN